MLKLQTRVVKQRVSFGGLLNLNNSSPFAGLSVRRGCYFQHQLKSGCLIFSEGGWCWTGIMALVVGVPGDC